MLCFCLALGALALSACGEEQEGDAADEPGQTGAESEEVFSDVHRIEDVVTRIRRGDTDALRGEVVEIEAYISPPPRVGSVPSTPPPGCPVVPEKQEWLTDDPAISEFEVAGTLLPNRLDGDTPLLRLVVPYTLGFVEIPERARLRGFVLDEAHEGCPQFRSLFILDEVLETLPAGDRDFQGEAITDWMQWTNDESGIVVEYPAGWDLEERDVGAVVQARFVGPDGYRPVRLNVQSGETFWHPDANADAAPPGPLQGDRREPAFVGPARARLVDDSTRTASGERELRLVFNHLGNTVTLAMIVRDGTSLEQESIAVFSEMAQRLRLRGDVAISDPMDAVLAAADELGDGPFLSEDDARYLAVSVAGLTDAAAVEAELVAERDARVAVSGACRDFEGNPPGVWLVTVDGTLPAGQEAYLLVYLDANTGAKLCQAEAPGVS